mmetsp:Transcript_16680/g.21083  ORF Transcript_16680/g.21083 Transcript_16680/m.21083 type:complete len:83 (-) Transcript_16680:226-474(-)|eukprot:CAMPEP_0170475252 /NCGR_PEP_ID=MMETSP0123-20130129/16932_1 /TAXON_ID=182087 /ORGANISM="Favella ehrenbergii, Strain Fehren 1" /LENGTH=82 /DNA_ID=CAMNT_0010745635 /DNA_START=194 /DNA_END=442 /DNA_ORIENTATION=-
MLHLTNESLKKNIFKWLLDTFDKLTRHDVELRRLKTQKAAKEESKSSSAMTFEKRAQMTDKEKLRAELVESSDEEQEVAGTI